MAKKRGFPLCAASKQGEQLVHGLVSKHSYAIVDLQEIKDPKTQKVNFFFFKNLFIKFVFRKIFL